MASAADGAAACALALRAHQKEMEQYQHPRARATEQARAPARARTASSSATTGGQPATERLAENALLQKVAASQLPDFSGEALRHIPVLTVNFAGCLWYRDPTGISAFCCSCKDAHRWYYSTFD